MGSVAVLFDLDGTLLDTLRDVGDAANQSLRDGGYPTHALGEYRTLLGGGIHNLFRSALPDGENSDQNINRCIEAFDLAYRVAWNVHTRPYPGIPELVAELTRRNIPLAVLSNKPHEFTRLCIGEYFDPLKQQTEPETTAIGPFAVVAGQRDGIPVKPDPTAALQIATHLDVPADHSFYVGDTSIDMETACRSGMRAIGVSWGFRNPQELIASGAESVIDNPHELLDLL